MPNLHELTTIVTKQSLSTNESIHGQLLIATMRVIADTRDNPIHEAASWVYHRAQSDLSVKARDIGDCPKSQDLERRSVQHPYSMT